MKSAKQTVDRFNKSWIYAKTNHHPRWRRNWKLYNNKRALVGYKGITNTFVPMTYGTVETLTAALCAGRPSIEFTPQDMASYIMGSFAHVPEVQKARNAGDFSKLDTSKLTGGNKPDLKALNSQFDYYWESDNWDLKTLKTVRSGFIYGTACEWVYWDEDKPRTINMNVRDVIIDPSLTDPMQLWTNPDDYYTGRRYLTNLSALKQVQVIDPKTGQPRQRFKNLDKVIPGTMASDQTDKEMKDSNMGSLVNDPNLVEVIEIWDGQTIKSIAQREVTIEDRPNTLGIHCLVIHRFLPDESLIYGKAIVDVIAHSQEYLNDVTNQRGDAVTDALNPQATLDPVYASWIPKLKNLPSSVYPFKPNSMQYLVKPRVDSAPFTETTGLKNDIREATAADQVVNGASATGDPTATEINTQVNQAGERFEIYVRMLEREGLYQRAKIVYRMMLVYVTDKQIVPVPSRDGPKFRRFDPAQFDQTYEPQIRLQANVKAHQTAQANQATQAYEIIIKDPTNDLWEAKKILYPKMFDLSEEELDKIIGSQKPVGPPMPPPGAEGLAPAPNAPHESISLSDIYKATTDPLIKAQIEKIANLQPSPIPPPMSDPNAPSAGGLPAPQVPAGPPMNPMQLAGPSIAGGMA